MAAAGGKKDLSLPGVTGPTTVCAQEGMHLFVGLPVMEGDASL